MTEGDIFEDGLADPLGRELRGKQELGLLSDADSRQVLRSIAAKFRIDERRVWWWESAIGHFRYSISHEGKPDDLKRIFHDQEDVYFVPTDDEPAPWKIYKVKISDLCAALNDLRIFEYFLSNMNLSVLCFDTHHDQYIVFSDNHIPSLE